MDEFSTGGHPCDLGISNCVNTLGSFKCQGTNGYESTSQHSCQGKLIKGKEIESKIEKIERQKIPSCKL